MMAERESISVVILSHNRLKDLHKNLLEWCKIGTSRLELVVVDNGSSDGSAEFLQQMKEAGKIKAILHEHNLGVAAGRNTGFRLAKGEIIICLDDDAYLSPAELDKIIRCFQEDETLGVLSLSVVHAVTGEKQNPHGNRSIEVANYHGAAHVLRSKAIREIGYLDEQCVFGGEELDSCIRLYEKGYHCWYVPEIIALHNSFHRQGRMGLSRLCLWVYNYARVLFKHFPYRMAILYANRLLMMHLFQGLRRFGVAGAFEIIKADYKGRQDGKEQHQPISDRTVRFYSNPDLRPEFGNVALSKKILNKISGHG